MQKAKGSSPFRSTMTNFQRVDPPITEWHTRPGAIHIPKDGQLDNGLFPAIVYYHGTGEAAKDNLELLMSQGLPNVVEMQGSVYGLDNLGIKRKFIVLAVQDEWFSPSPEYSAYFVPWLLKNYKVDPNYLYASGLSAGGQQSNNTLVGNLTSAYFAAGVPMSIAGWDRNMTNLVTNKIKTWYFVGNQDGSYLSFTKEAHTAAETALPGSSKITIFQGGHGPWTPYYTPTWKENGVSIYDWMLKNAKISQVPPIPPIEKRLLFTLKVYSDGTTEEV